jgi:DNA-binding GntR family transcriptional regulator
MQHAAWSMRHEAIGGPRMEGARMTIGIAKGPTLGEQVYAYIREKIVNDHYRPGQVIVESELAQELNVSRTPVSNAVIMLKERGLIEDRGGKLTVLDLSIRDVIDLYQCRLAFDGLAARLAAERITEAELDALASHLDVWEQVVEAPDTNALWVADLSFHELIYAASRNAHLQRFSEIATDLLSTYRRVILDNLAHGPDQQRGPEDVRREHEALYARLRVRDADGAEAAARFHILSVVTFLERVESGTRDASLRRTSDAPPAERRP